MCENAHIVSESFQGVGELPGAEVWGAHVIGGTAAGGTRQGQSVRRHVGQ